MNMKKSSFEEEFPSGTKEILTAVAAWTILAAALWLRIQFIDDSAYRKGRKFDGVKVDL